METNTVTGVIIEKSIGIHRRLGPGLLESVYRKILAYELRKCGLSVDEEVPVDVDWDGNYMDLGFRADLIVEEVVVELKSVETTHPVHRKQLLTYLKVMDRRVGLLINFGEGLLKDGIHRLVNQYADD